MTKTLIKKDTQQLRGELQKSNNKEFAGAAGDNRSVASRNGRDDRRFAFSNRHYQTSARPAD